MIGGRQAGQGKSGGGAAKARRRFVVNIFLWSYNMLSEVHG